MAIRSRESWCPSCQTSFTYQLTIIVNVYLFCCTPDSSRQLLSLRPLSPRWPASQGTVDPTEEPLPSQSREKHVSAGRLKRHITTATRRQTTPASKNLLSMLQNKGTPHTLTPISCHLPEALMKTTAVTLTARGSPGVTPLTVKPAGSTVKCPPVRTQPDQVTTYTLRYTLFR